MILRRAGLAPQDAKPQVEGVVHEGFPSLCSPLCQSKPSESVASAESVRGFRSEGLRLGRLDRDHFKTFHSIVFAVVVVAPKCDLRLDDDSFGDLAVELLGVCDADFGQVFLRDFRGIVREPDIVPDEPLCVLAVEDLEGHFVTRRAGLRL